MSPDGIRAYEAVNAGGDLANIEQLVALHAPLVKRIAYHLAARLPPEIETSDLIQSGIIGLIEAAQNFDASRNASFETFAGIRIRGAMIDSMRPNSWTPRSVARKAREYAAAVQHVEARLGREASDNEVIAELGTDEASYYATLRDISATKLLSYDALLEDDGLHGDGVEPHSRAEDMPDAAAQRDRFKASLVESMRHLPEQQQMVLSLYYQEELNLREIGEVLSLTESRVSQIHSKAIANLRLRLSGWLDERNDDTLI